MNDNQLIQLFLSVLRPGLDQRGLNAVQLLASNQGTQQGTINAPAVYFTKLYDAPYGYMSKKTTFNYELLRMKFIESQYYETTFQFQALIPNSSDPDALTASDTLINALAVLQGEAAMRFFAQNEVNLLRVSQLRNPFFTNDVDQYQAVPNFDITFLHNRVFEYEIPFTSRIELIIAEV